MIVIGRGVRNVRTRNYHVVQMRFINSFFYGKFAVNFFEENSPSNFYLLSLFSVYAPKSYDIRKRVVYAYIGDENGHYGTARKEEIDLFSKMSFRSPARATIIVT